ncbi:MAG: type VI secretion system tube protein Hcp [Dehalococcoidia bacterium]
MFKFNVASAKRVPLLIMVMVIAVVGSAGAIAANNVNAQTKTGPELDASASCPGCASAAYIKFGGIEGESQDKDHDGWSDILSFNQGIVAPTSTGPGAARRRGAPVLEDIIVTKELDKSTPKLAEAIVNGRTFPTVEIHLTRNLGDGVSTTYYAYELKNVRVTSYNIGNTRQNDLTPSGLPHVRTASSSGVPTEELSLNFEEIKVTYTEIDEAGRAKGTVEYSWKVEEGRR